MFEFLYLIPLLAGAAILILALRTELPRGPAMRRKRFGAALVAASLWLWLGNAWLLVTEGKFYFILEWLTVVIFFTGLAYFVPPPTPHAEPKEHRVLGHALIWAGALLGLAHAVALLTTEAWTAQLLRFYAAIGLGPR